jgi:hypothetical protein
VSFDDASTNSCRAGSTCIRNDFRAIDSGYWGGWYFQNGVLSNEAQPRCNWGEVPNAGFDLTGATRVTFWARGERGGEQIEFFAGGLGVITGMPYPDSFSRVPDIGQSTTLTNIWQQYAIDLSGKNLSYVVGGFAWVASAAKNPSGAVFYLDDIRYDKARLDDPRLLVSYDALPTPPGSDFDTILRNVGFTYDNDVVLLAYLARASDPASPSRADDLRRARLLADALVYAQNRDRYYTDGRVRNAYQAGDLKLPAGWTPNGRVGAARLPGWWDVTLKQWFEDKAQVGSDTGNQAWTMLALLRAFQTFGTPAYLTAARRLGNWIVANTRDTRGAGGYTGGFEGWEPNPTRRTWKSTEHNLDVFVAFMELADVTSEPERSAWRLRAFHARTFVRNMWEGCGPDHFATGTTNDGVTANCDFRPVDVNTWGVMVLGGTYARGIRWVEEQARVSEACFVPPHPSPTATGIDFNDDKDGIWWEGTAHTVLAERIVGFSFADVLLQNLRLAQTHGVGGNGRALPATCHDRVTTGIDDFQLYNRRHIAATAWYALAELGHNPYWGIDTTAPIPHEGDEFERLHADVPVGRTLLSGGEADTYEITVPARTRVVLQATTGGTIEPCLRLIRPSGAPAPSGATSSCATTKTARLNVVIGPGTYIVNVTDGAGDESGAYTLIFEPLSRPPAVSLTSDTIVADTLNPRGDLDLFTFTLTQQSRVVLQASTASATEPCVRLHTPADSPTLSGTTSNCAAPTTARLNRVLAAGTYFVEVSDSGNNETGAYRLVYERVAPPATALALDTPATGMIAPQADVDLFMFSVSRSTRVILQAVSAGAVDPCMRLMAPPGAPPLTGATSSCKSGSSAVVDVNVPTGTYFVEMSDYRNDETGGFTLTWRSSATP